MKQVLRSASGLPTVRDMATPVCPVGGALVRTAVSILSSGTEGAAVASAQQSLLSRARARPDLVRTVVRRAISDGISSTRAAVQDKLTAETPVGYSSAGYVIEVGEGVRSFGPGDLVALAGAGHANHAEIASVPANLMARVPAGVSPQAAALTTLASVAMHALRTAGVSVGDRVAVIGCGLIGQLACRLLATAGAQVIAVDIDRARCDQARTSGATAAFVAGEGTVEQVHGVTSGLGVDSVLVCAASRSGRPLVQAAEIARDRGTLVVVGDVPLDVPRAAIYRKELNIRMARSYGPGRYDLEYEERGLDYPIGYVRWTQQRNMESILALQAVGRLRLDDLIVETYPIEHAADAFARLVAPPSERPRGAVALTYSGSAEHGGEPAKVSTTIDTTVERAAKRMRRTPEPMNPVRIGLIGPGAFATRVLLPAFRSAGVILEVLGGGRSTSTRTAEKLGFRRAASSEEELISSEDIDAVVIATRHGTHARLAKLALESGKHVFCEKPLALNTEELAAVLAAAQSSGRVLSVGFNRRFAPLFVQGREFLRHDGIGSTTVSLRVSAGAVAAESWIHDLRDGGGRMLGEGCHFVDSLVALVRSPIVSVHAAGHGQPLLPIQAYDNVMVTLRFADSSIGSIVYVAQGSRRLAKERLEAFAGTRTVVLDDFRELLLYGGSAKAERVTLERQDKGHLAEVAAFVSGVRTATPPVPLAELANVSFATLAIVESMRTGLPVQIVTES